MTRPTPQRRGWLFGAARLAALSLLVFVLWSLCQTARAAGLNGRHAVTALDQSLCADPSIVAAEAKLTALEAMGLAVAGSEHGRLAEAQAQWRKYRADPVDNDAPEGVSRCHLDDPVHPAPQFLRCLLWNYDQRINDLSRDVDGGIRRMQEAEADLLRPNAASKQAIGGAREFAITDSEMPTKFDGLDVVCNGHMTLTAAEAEGFYDFIGGRGLWQVETLDCPTSDNPAPIWTGADAATHGAGYVHIKSGYVHVPTEVGRGWCPPRVMSIWVDQRKVISRLEFAASCERLRIASIVISASDVTVCMRDALQWGDPKLPLEPGKCEKPQLTGARRLIARSIRTTPAQPRSQET